jgi:protein SCO1/2
VTIFARSGLVLLLLAMAAAAGETPLREGDTVPDFKLANDRGEILTRESFVDKTLVITFVFVRCQLPDHCGAIARNFKELAARIDTDEALQSRVRLLSISVDPVHDTDQSLTDYRRSLDAPRELWQVTTGSGGQIAKLTALFGVQVERQGNTLAHTLCTVIVDPAGKIKKIVPGAAWKPDDLLPLLR